MSRRQGTVTAFDAERGLGRIRGDDGVELDFHCVEITDGTRRIDVGAAVAFEVVLRLGRPEAARVTP